MLIKPRVGCYAVYEPPEEGWQDWNQQFTLLNEQLITAGMEVIAAPEPVMDSASCERVALWFQSQQLDILHALVITWSFDHYTILIQQMTGLPVAIRSIPGIRTGSLVGGQQLNCVLTDLQVEHRLLFGPLESVDVFEEFTTYARACAIRRNLRGSNMAVIGRRTEGMTPTAVDEIEILRLFGVRLLNYGLDEFYEMQEKISLSEAKVVWQELAAGAKAMTAKPEHGVAAAQSYLAFKRMIQDLNLSAISVGSYPKCQGTMCVPIALLNNEGFPVGCEGDVNSTLAMWILSMLTEKPVHFGEMLDINEEENSIVTSHCGCGSPWLADEHGFILCPVRLANDGVCVRFSARRGPVTFVNLVGRKGNYRMCALEGNAIPTRMVFEGNPLKLVLKIPFRQAWKEFAPQGFGHHWMTVYEHVAPILREFSRISGIPGVFPDLE